MNERIRHLLRRAVMAVAIWGLCAAAGAQSEPQGAARPLVAAFPANFPPIFSVTSNGVPTGHGIEFMEEVAARTGLSVEYRPMPDWAAVLAAVKAGDVDLVPDIGVTTGRSDLLDFTHAVETVPVSLFVRSADSAALSGIADLLQRDAVLAVVRANVAQTLLARRQARLREFDSVSSALFALQTGEVDGVVYPEPVVKAFLRRLRLEQQIVSIGDPLTVVNRAIGVRKGQPELVERLNGAVAQIMASPVHDAIHERWYGGRMPFWTATRVTAAVVAVCFLAACLILLQRVRLLKHLNEKLESASRYNGAVLNSVIEGVVTIDGSGVIRSANPAAEHIFERSAAGLVGNSVWQLFKDADCEVLRRCVAEEGAAGPREHCAGAVATGREVQGVREGTAFPARVGIAAATVGNETLYVCTVHDLSEQRRIEQRLEYLADHDPLTGLLNHHGAALVLRTMLEQAGRRGLPVTCVNIGISRFSRINELYGRTVGDAVLVQVASFIRTWVCTGNSFPRSRYGLVARASGDQFVIMLPETGVDEAQIAARRLLDGIQALVVRVGDDQMRVDGCSGIASSTVHGGTPDQLLSHAEIALLHAKGKAVSRIAVFDEETRQQDSQAEKSLENVRWALAENRFLLHFQPIVEIATGEVHHFEGLVRMRTTDNQLIMPGQFIPVAERFGLIGPVDYRVLELAFQHLAAWRQEGLHASLAINLSGAHIGDDYLYRWLRRHLGQGGVSPPKLIFEITETAALGNLSRAKAFMDSLKELGCRFALDDFGVGFTSFSQLRTLPVDMVKIDGSFVVNLQTSEQDQALVRAITDVAHSLGKEVVAEFVEKAEVLELLGHLGVDYAQGYYLGCPAAEPVISEPALRPVPGAAVPVP